MLGLNQLWNLLIFCEKERLWKTSFQYKKSSFSFLVCPCIEKKKNATHTYDVICFEPLQEWRAIKGWTHNFWEVVTHLFTQYQTLRDWSEHSHIHIVLQFQYPLQILFTFQGELNLFIFCFRKNVQASSHGITIETSPTRTILKKN